MDRMVVRVSARSRESLEGTIQAFYRRVAPQLLSTPGRLDVIDVFERIDQFYPWLTPAVEHLPQGRAGETRLDGTIALSEQTYNEAVRGIGRARFTVTHELVHGLLHVGQMAASSLARETSIPTYCSPEWQANYGGSAMLMPRWSMHQLRDQSANQIANFFGASLQAAEIRKRQLGM